MIQAPATSSETRARALSEEQLSDLLKHVQPEFLCFIELLACAGLRIGEAVALQWQDVDLTEGLLSVKRAVYKGELGQPKSRFGIRTIPLTRPLAHKLRAHRLASGIPPQSWPVFATSNGTMHLPANLHRRVMKPAAATAGVPWASFHTLRHTFASHLFRNGCNIKQIQRLLGHHSAAFTLERYVHLLAEDQPDLSFLERLAR